jgi:hypothetical protein
MGPRHRLGRGRPAPITTPPRRGSGWVWNGTSRTSGLVGAGDHHLLTGQGLVDIAAKMGLDVLEVDLRRRIETGLVKCNG